MVFGARGAGNSDVSFRVKGFLVANWADDDRIAPGGPQETHGHVDLLDIDESAGPNLDARIAFPIRPYRSIVVHAGGEIAEMRRRQCFARGGLEIHHVEGLVR